METTITYAANPKKKRATASRKYSQLARQISQAVIDGLRAKKAYRAKNDPDPDPEPGRRYGRRAHNEPNPRRRYRRRKNPAYRTDTDFESVGMNLGMGVVGAVGGYVVASWVSNQITQRYPQVSWLKPGFITLLAGLPLVFWRKAPAAVKAFGTGMVIGGATGILLPMLAPGGFSDMGELAQWQTEDGRIIVPVIRTKTGEVIPVLQPERVQTLSDNGYDVEAMEAIGRDWQGNLILQPVGGQMGEYVPEISEYVPEMGEYITAKEV